MLLEKRYRSFEDTWISMSIIHPMQVTFLDLIILPLWETWAELVYPDAQEMLDNLSQTREYWVSQVKCASPPLSENEPEGEDPKSATVNGRPLEEVSVDVPQPKEHCSVNCCDAEGKSVSSESDESSSLQNSSDSLKFQNSPANQRR